MNILLGVCGSISAYKSFDILRGLLKNGHKVRVVCTRGAENFIKPNLFLYLGASRAYSSLDDFSYPANKNKEDMADDSSTVLHIELAKWADKIVICPMSANTLANLAHGMTPDLLTSIFLACPSETPILLYPAMNTQMYKHPFTNINEDQVQKIQTLPKVFVHKPESGLLACGDTGEGKLPSVEKILDTIECCHNKTDLKSKHILITTGATISALDPVRYLTNASSGLTGHLLAIEALSQGHTVTVIAGKNATARLDHLLGLPGHNLMRVTSTEEMATKVHEEIKRADIYISTAAINDIRFISKNHKLKKEELSNSLEIEKTQDILKSVIKNKRPGQKIVGFAAETNLSFAVLDRKYKSKPVDLLVGTLVHHGLSLEGQEQSDQLGFATDDGKYKFFADGEINFEGTLSKKDLAKNILKRVISD